MGNYKMLDVTNKVQEKIFFGFLFLNVQKFTFLENEIKLEEENVFDFFVHQKPQSF